ncbi:hypothetical protein ACFYTS_30900 [Nocardia sp. NPDC004151]
MLDRRQQMARGQAVIALGVLGDESLVPPSAARPQSQPANLARISL